MQSDERGFRIAVLANDLMDQDSAGFDVLDVLERAGWGAITLPPAWYPDDVGAGLLVQFAEHIEEFVRHGYDVVWVGSCEGLAGPLTDLGVEMPDSVTPASADELERFLAGRPLPAARQ